MSELEEELKKISAGKMLDVGCGRGEFIQIITEYFKDYLEIIGIDNSEKAIAYCKENYKQENIKFVKMDAQRIEFEDNSLDTVCISNTLHHLPNLSAVLKEMYRVLKPGGLFIINEMFSDEQTEKQLSHVYIHHLCGEMDRLMGTYHSETFKKQQIIDAAKSTGVKVESVFEYDTAKEQEAETNDKVEKEILDSCFNSVDKYLEKIKESHQYEDIKNRADLLKEKLYKVGFMGATELIVFGRK